MRQCKAWWYSDQCIRTEDMRKFVNVPDCEEGYPLLKSELPPGNLMQQHPHHPLVYWPETEPRITLGYLNFMYSKLVCSFSEILSGFDLCRCFRCPKNVKSAPSFQKCPTLF